MIARDTMHQWLAALEDLKVKDLRNCCSQGAYEYGKSEFAYQFWNHSEGRKALKVAGLGSFNGWQGEFSMWRILSHWDRNQNHHSPTRACGTAKTIQTRPSDATGEP